MTPRPQCPTIPPRPLPGPAGSPEDVERALREAREGLKRLRTSLQVIFSGVPGSGARTARPA